MEKENDEDEYNISFDSIINFCIERKRIVIAILFLLSVLIYLPLHDVLINWISPPVIIPEPWYVFWK